MNLNQFTIKSQEAIQKAQQIAMEMGHQSIENGHLMKGIEMSDQSVTPYLYKKLGVNAERIHETIAKIIESYPKVTGGEAYLSKTANESVQKALSALTQLRTQQLWQKGEIKEYQSRLTYIIREYLENRYEVSALESTTDEIVKNIRSANIDLTDIDSLKRILQVADLVKFAKAKPDESIHDTFMDEAEEFVTRTKLTPTIEEENSGDE